MTISEHRSKEVLRLARYKNPEPTENDISEARSVMNSFYRLCGLCERNLYLANDPNWCDKKYTKWSEEREERWRKRLNKKLIDVYGLRIVHFGYLPSICFATSTAEAISRFFYN